MYTCKRCGAKFETAIMLASHTRKEHPKEGRREEILRRLSALEEAVFGRKKQNPPEEEEFLLTATDGTPITKEMRNRGKVVETFSFSNQAFTVFEDPITKKRWIEVKHTTPPPWKVK